jgi:SAM-dependent methyltransferase
MRKDDARQQVENYPELRAYYAETNEPEVKREHLWRILTKRLQEVPSDYSFHILDVGCSNGEMSLPLVMELKKRLPRLRYTALEPERPAFEKLLERVKGQAFIQAVNTTFEAYLQTLKGQRELFDSILFSQSFYCFPKGEWNEIIADTLRLLKPKGVATIVLDSWEGKAYKLCDLISSGKAETLAFGDLYSAEDMERFLTDKRIAFETDRFPIYIFIKDDQLKLNQFARTLAFLYRTLPEKILARHREAVEKFLEECKSNNQYVLENVVKAITFTK